MGGLGYSAYTQIGSTININDLQTTFEGDNQVLLQQTAKFVLKNAYKIIRGKKFNESLSFINDYFKDKEQARNFNDDFKSLENLTKILRANTSFVINSYLNDFYRLLLEVSMNFNNFFKKKGYMKDLSTVCLSLKMSQLYHMDKHSLWKLT